MPLAYISSKTTLFHPDASSPAQEFVLIYGDEVHTTGVQDNNRDEVVYRGRTGWVSSDRLMPDHPMEMYFIDVGQGDSTFIVTPAGRTILVDGGAGDEAFQFLVWKYRLDQGNDVDIDLLVLTHTDEDHIGGLVSIIEHPHINVRRIAQSGIARYRSGVHNTPLGRVEGAGDARILVSRHDAIQELDRGELTATMQRWFDAVVAEQAGPGMTYGAVDATTGNINVGDPAVTLTVLGPKLTHDPTHGTGYRWLSSAAETVNGHSVVLRLDFDEIRILLPGDINELGSAHLLSDVGFPAEASAHVLKAPHHGSHQFEPAFLRAVNPQFSVISSGESPDHGHPRANFLGSVGRYSRSAEPLVFSTELVAMFAVDEDAAASDADDPVDPTDPALIGQARRRFKKRLNGLINIRTDGRQLYAARRVAASYQFVAYGPVAPVPHDP